MKKLEEQIAERKVTFDEMIQDLFQKKIKCEMVIFQVIKYIIQNVHCTMYSVLCILNCALQCILWDMYVMFYI